MNIYLLSETYHEGVINLPLIQSKPLDIQLDVNHYDALIFSSKNGVYAIENINKNWKHIPAFCIGEATAQVVKNLGGKVVFVSKSAYGNDFAKEIIEYLKDKKTLFLRAKKVLSNLENILLNANIDLDSQVVYETKCQDKQEISFTTNSIIIFTSPSTIKCFFHHYKWRDDLVAICIGKVTQESLPQNIRFYLPKKQSIHSCIELAKTLIKQS